MGTKVTGQGGSWGFGLLDVQGQIVREDKPLTGNYHVGRYIHNVGENSHIGGIWANSNRSDGTNITGGLDSRVYFDSTTSLTTQFLGMRDSEGIETNDIYDHDAYAGYAGLRGGTNPLTWQLDYRDISRGFEPDLGYIPRRDIRGPGSSFEYREYLDSGIFKSISAESRIDVYENNDHDTTLRDFREEAGVCFRNEVELKYARSDSFHAPYQNWYDGVEVEYNEDGDVWDSVSAGVRKGVYEEKAYSEYSLDKPIKLTERLVTTFEGNFRIEEPQTGGDEDIWLWRSVTQYNFRWNGRIKFTAERTSENRHNLTMLFSWLVNKTTDLYVLLNDYKVDGEEVRAAFVKVVYRF